MISGCGVVSTGACGVGVCSGAVGSGLVGSGVGVDAADSVGSFCCSSGYSGVDSGSAGICTAVRAPSTAITAWDAAASGKNGGSGGRKLRNQSISVLMKLTPAATDSLKKFVSPWLKSIAPPTQ